MNTMKLLALGGICGVVLLVTGCRPSGGQGSGSVDGVNIVVRNMEESHLIPMSDYVESYRVVPLETDSNCLLGEIVKLRANAKGIFVQDRGQRLYSPHIYRFDNQGRFLNTIGRLGSGPEESTEITSFAVDDRQGLVYIYSRTDDRVVIYTVDGRFVRRIPVNYGYGCNVIEYAQGKLYLGGMDCDSIPYHVLAVDPQSGKVLEGYNLIPEGIDGGSRTPLLSVCQDVLYYNSNMNSDTIYRVGDNGVLEVAFRMDWGEHALPESAWKMINEEILDFSKDRERVHSFNRLVLEKQYVPGVDQFAVFDRFLYFGYRLGGVGQKGIYNRETGEVLIPTLSDDLSYMLTDFIGQTDTELIFWFDGNGIDDRIEQIQTEDWQKSTGTSAEKVAETVERLKKLQARIGEDPNPVLVFYKVKE